LLQVTPVLCDSVAKWQEVVPVAAALRNQAMQDRHWTKLQQGLGIMLPIGAAFTLQTLFDLKVGDGFALTALALAMCRVSDVLLDKQACQRDRACNILHKGTTVAASTDANERMT